MLRSKEAVADLRQRGPSCRGTAESEGPKDMSIEDIFANEEHRILERCRTLLNGSFKFFQETERTEMLNHFRSLSLEATVLESNNHSLESEAAEVRGALQNAKHQILDLERQLADRDCLTKGYETQVSCDIFFILNI